MCKSPDSALVSQESIKIVSATHDRRGLFLRNMSNKTIWISFDHPAEKNKGIPLMPSESFSMSAFDYSQADVYAISDGNNSLVCIQEFVSQEAY